MSITSFAKRVHHKLYIIFIRLINKVIPKNPNRMVFISLPDYSDNSKGLWEYVTANTHYDTVWLFNNKDLAEKLQKVDLHCYFKDSFEGIKAFLTAKYIVCTHSQYINIKSGSQVLINLWHGMPLKAMGYLDQTCSEKDIKDFNRSSKSTDIFISTSPIMRYVLSSCFKIDARKVAVTGQPRNDKLFGSLNKDLLSKIIGEKALGYDKYIFYCPTFRSGMGRVEGKIFNENVFNFSDYDKGTFDSLLKSNNALLIIKLHPFEEKQFEETDLNLPENAVLLKSNNFNRNLASIYDILNIFDVLITDYSSIYFDYLLLDRPMLFVTSDLNQYKNGRGLIFDDYNFWTPGPKTNTFSEFIPNLDKCMKDKEFYSSERNTINGLVNRYSDGNSSKRVIELISKFK